MKLRSKSEWFELEKPIGEPDLVWMETQGKYLIERSVNVCGTIVWFGININWKKELNENWTVLSINENAKPLEKYLPKMIYGSDRTYWKECSEPVYETLYNKMNILSDDQQKNYQETINYLFNSEKDELNNFISLKESEEKLKK